MPAFASAKLSCAKNFAAARTLVARLSAMNASAKRFQTLVYLLAVHLHHLLCRIIGILLTWDCSPARNTLCQYHTASSHSNWLVLALSHTTSNPDTRLS